MMHDILHGRWSMNRSAYAPARQHRWSGKFAYGNSVRRWPQVGSRGTESGVGDAIQAILTSRNRQHCVAAIPSIQVGIATARISRISHISPISPPMEALRPPLISNLKQEATHG